MNVKGQLNEIWIKEGLRDSNGNPLAYADHYIYMRGIRSYSEIEDPVQRATQQEYDLLVADFVARLMFVGTTSEKAIHFLSEDSLHVRIVNGVYEFYPLGVPKIKP